MALEPSQLAGPVISGVIAIVSMIAVSINIDRQLRRKAMTEAATGIWDVVSELQMQISVWSLSGFLDTDPARTRIQEELHPKLMRTCRQAQLLIDVPSTNHLHDIIGDLAQLTGRSDLLALEKRADGSESSRIRIQKELRALEARMGASFEATLVSLQRLIHPRRWVSSARAARADRPWYGKQRRHRPLIPPIDREN